MVGKMSFSPYAFSLFSIIVFSISVASAFKPIIFEYCGPLLSEKSSSTTNAENAENDPNLIGVKGVASYERFGGGKYENITDAISNTIKFAYPTSQNKFRKKRRKKRNAIHIEDLSDHPRCAEKSCEYLDLQTQTCRVDTNGLVNEGESWEREYIDKIRSSDKAWQLSNSAQLYRYSTTKKSKASNLEVDDLPSYRNKIPPIIHQIHADESKINLELMSLLLRKSCPGCQLWFWTDEIFLKFVQKYPLPDLIPNVVEIFLNPTLRGAHKGDLIVYYVLYIVGGVYLDFDTFPVKVDGLAELLISSEYFNFS